MQTSIDSFFSPKKRTGSPISSPSPKKQRGEAKSPLKCPDFEMELVENLHDDSWKLALKNEFKKPYFKKLADFLRKDKEEHTIYPPIPLVFSAFNLCPFDKVQVVIIGQDPYHGAGQAHGLAFSVQKGVTIPPSLRNIYKELKEDIAGFVIPDHGNLEHWAKQGVLLLNVCLTVREGKPNSHKSHGWENFTDEAIKQISRQRSGVVFLLWGAPAQKKQELINTSKHKIFTAAHPSPLSVKGFLGCKHFSLTNEYLIQHGATPIDWCFPDTKKAKQTTKDRGSVSKDEKNLKNKEIKEKRVFPEEKEKKPKEEECNVSTAEPDLTPAQETLSGSHTKRSSTNVDQESNDESTVTDDTEYLNAITSKGKTDDSKKNNLKHKRQNKDDKV